MPRPEGRDSADMKSHILRGLVKLPPMAQVILKAQEIIAHPHAGLGDLARIIEKDPALSARVLALANSAYFGLSGEVSTVRHASILLGLTTLGDAITLAASSVLLNRELDGYALEPQALWKHSLCTALCAREIAGKRFPAQAGDAFIVGLLHDVGKIMLDPFIQKHRNPDGPPTPSGQARITPEIEKGWLGSDHAEIMALACRFWRFPEAQVNGIRFHHHPAGASRCELAYVAHVADSLSHRLGLDAGESEASGLDETTLEFLQLSPADLDDLQAAMVDALEKLEGEFRGRAVRPLRAS